MIVRDVMTDNPMTVNESARVTEAMDILQELDIRHLPVVRGAELIGIVSDRDLGSVYRPSLDDEEAVARLEDMYNSSVSEFMSTSLVQVDPESDLREAVQTMLENRVGALPVVDASSGDLVGILSYVDVLRVAEPALGKL